MGHKYFAPLLTQTGPLKSKPGAARFSRPVFGFNVTL
jgi:hypothetical protein